MFTLKVLTSSVLKMFVRNRQAVFFTLFMPIVIMTVFGFIGFDNVPKTDVGIAINAPPTEGTKNFIEQLKMVPAFNIHIGTEPAERQALEEGDRAVVFLVPYNLMSEKPGSIIANDPIKVLTNSGQAQQAATAVSILNQILDKTTLAMTQAPQFFKLQVDEINSRNLKYFDFLLPGVIAMAVMQMAVFSVAFVFVDYKEKGILKRLIATPMKPYQFVTANVVTRLLVAVVQTAVLVAVGVLLFKAQMIGSYWLLLLIVILGAVMFLGLGFAISGLANTVETVPAIANLVVFPMLFLGGTFFPIDSMPSWLQSIVNYMPLTHLSNSSREVMNNGATFDHIQNDIYWMLAWSVVLVILANISFGFEEKRQ